MIKSELIYKLTGTETPQFVNERETTIIDKCLVIINEKESEIKGQENTIANLKNEIKDLNRFIEQTVNS
jgi:hypothetical protein